MKKIARIIGIIAALLVLVILGWFNSLVTSAVAYFIPAAQPALWFVLFAVELAVFAYYFFLVWRKEKHLVFTTSPTPEQRQEFRLALEERLRVNKYIKESDISLQDPEFTEKSLDYLGALADKEIENTAKRVFLATALSQNGRIDAVIVFYSLSRLVWRISKIYNQKPHPQEVAALYTAVVSSTFLALSFEELDISTEVAVSFGELVQAITPAAMTTSVPFVGAALTRFTASVVDGAGNCFLALRTGVITRNAFTYGGNMATKPNRAAVFKESGKWLLKISNEVMERIAKSFASSMWNMAYSGTISLGKGVGKGVSSAVSGVTTGVATGVATVGTEIAHGVTTVGKEVGKGVSSAVSGVTTGVATVGKGVGSVTVDVASGIANGVTTVGKGVGTVASTVVSGVASGVSDAGSSVVNGINSLGKFVFGDSEENAKTGKDAKDTKKSKNAQQ